MKVVSPSQNPQLRRSSFLIKILLGALAFSLTPLFSGDFSESATNSFATRPAGNPASVSFQAGLQYRTRAGGLAVVDAVGHSGDAVWHNFGSALNPDWRLKTQTFLRPEYVQSYSIGQHVTFSGFQTWVTLGADPTNVGNSSEIQQYYQSNLIGGVSAESRIYQMLGMPDNSASESKILAHYWVKADDLIRPAYNWDIGGNATPLNYDPDSPVSGFGVIDAPWTAESPFTMVNYDGSTMEISDAGSWGDWISSMQQESTYPWTAMGYTLDWGFDTDPSSALNRSGAGFDTFGLSEFILKDSTDVIFAGYIANSDLESYLNGNAVMLIPEPGVLLLIWVSLPIFLFTSRFRFLIFQKYFK